MSKTAKKFNKDVYSEDNHYFCDYAEKPELKKTTTNIETKKRFKKKLLKFFIGFAALSLLLSYGYFVCPYNYKNYFEPIFLNRFLNRNLKLNIEHQLFPLNKYFHNSYFINGYQLTPRTQKTKEITDISIVSEMTQTKEKLLELFKQYPKIKPAVFVWEYSTGAGLEINSDEVYPSASIIKIPIAFELIRLIDDSSKTINPITLSDKRIFDESFRTEGSGSLQFGPSNIPFTLNHLANIMIAESDNSATNMILYEIGGVDGFNRAMRNLGLKTTSMHSWLADLEGTNKITAREISKILYNIDNPNYINPKYKTILKEYLGNTKNIHLLKEKLPQGVMVLHKTGNIGEMIGDSGIIYANNGKKYIATILAKRPRNDLSARNLIQEASLIIYNDINNL